MTLDQIKKKIESGVINSTVLVEGEGCNCSVTVISLSFENLASVNRQKMVLASLKGCFERDGGTLHAITMTTKTPEE